MEVSTAGPASGLSRIFTLGGSTGDVGLSQPISSSSTLASDQFPLTSQLAPTELTDSQVPSFSSLCAALFNDNINSSVFDLHTDSADLADKETPDQKEGQARRRREWFVHREHQEFGGKSCWSVDSTSRGRVGFTGGAQRNAGRNFTNLEGKECKGAAEKGGGGWKRFSWIQAGRGRMREVCAGRSGDEDPGSASTRFSEMSQLVIFCEKEEQQIQADIGLQTSQQRGERNTLQNGRSQDSGEVTSKRGLRYNNIFSTIELSNSCSPFFRSFSFFHFQRQNTHLQRNAPRLQGRAPHFHTRDEDSLSRNTKQMGSALPSLSGRYLAASSRPEQASDSNEGENRMAWKAWTVGQLRPEQTAAETDIQLSRIDVEDEERFSQPGTREMQVLEDGVRTVDETCKEKRRSPDQEFCIVCRSHQIHTVRHQRRFASNEQIIPGPQ
ncbi:uncharacterized protein MONOS_4972 [Monocercomonoides exilis]|uniref:uncharacterized protein n=1 Tax=Monocercomonoides exilis TaxID=2049356 RepID=UPI003559E687|nr:hypothetical protein MONOS_4972 [Monocercomonoides exilis]|eukprot:MONOS_4972.1-p1 / transcript=MONOS_4972.1 / gene=MONOS_4972 / organism=Monocercomonoides_exilis_PA203 / gene_product=unspecified product / transcript_product=unspecified product / location=Mono_scaffold00139:67008-68504(-) / protein_length=440 / sequence_SO=supercontig / SO=protein_coding / is_pseudo=false